MRFGALPTHSPSSSAKSTHGFDVEEMLNIGSPGRKSRRLRYLGSSDKRRTIGGLCMLGSNFMSPSRSTFK